MSKEIYLIAAVADNGVIGKNNDLVWHIKEDMNFFKSTTKEEIVLMGRRNYDSIPPKYRPLPNRLNCILTRNTTFTADECPVFQSIEEWIAAFENDPRKSFVIGGGQVYKESLDKQLVDIMFISHVHGTPEGDTFFPSINEQEWEIETIGSGEKNEVNEFGFTIKKYTRK